MYEKIAAGLVMVVSIVSMVFLEGLGLPWWITVPLVLVCTLAYLMGVVFLFSEGTIIKWPQRVKRVSRVALRNPLGTQE